MSPPKASGARSAPSLTELSMMDIYYHRALDGGAQRVPYVDFQVRQEAFEHAGAFTVYRIRGSEFAPVIGLKKKNQNFASYATPWERLHSQLVQRSLWMEPVVDENFLVIGHIGWVDGKSLYVPKGLSTWPATNQEYPPQNWESPARKFAKTVAGIGTMTAGLAKPAQSPASPSLTLLNNLIMGKVAPFAQGTLPCVAIAGSPPGCLVDFDVSDASYRVVTDVDGRVVAALSRRQREDTTSDTFQPQDLILVPLVTGAAVAAGARAAMALEDISLAANRFRGTLWTLARRGGARIMSGFSGEIPSVIPRAIARYTTPEFAAVDTAVINDIRGSVTPEVMNDFCLRKLAMRRELRELMEAAHLPDAAKKAKTLSALRMWAEDNRKIVEYWTEGTVAPVSGSPRNLLTLQGNKLIVDRSVLANGAVFHKEVAHELVADALGWSGTIDKHFLGWIYEQSSFTSQWVLEQAIEQGSLKQVMSLWIVP